MKQKKRKSIKRKHRLEMMVSTRALVGQGVIGSLVGIIGALFMLVMAAAGMKMTHADLASVGGWVLAVKLIAGLTAGFMAVRQGGPYLWLRGMASGMISMIIVYLILAAWCGFEPLCLMTDGGLGAACGMTAGCLQRIFKG